MSDILCINDAILGPEVGASSPVVTEESSVLEPFTKEKIV